MDPQPSKDQREKLPPVDRVFALAEELHRLFLEYRDEHGCDEETAWARACCEYLDAKNGEEANGS